MEYKAARSFIDPQTGTAYQIGDAYHSTDDEHSDYLLQHELISYAVPPAPPVENTLGGDSADEGDAGGAVPDEGGSAVPEPEPEHESDEAGESEETVIDEKPKRGRKRGDGNGAD